MTKVTKVPGTVEMKNLAKITKMAELAKMELRAEWPRRPELTKITKLPRTAKTREMAKIA